MKTKYRWKIYLKYGDASQLFYYYDYDSVQNLIGYLCEGANMVELTIIKETVEEVA